MCNSNKPEISFQQNFRNKRMKEGTLPTTEVSSCIQGHIAESTSMHSRGFLFIFSHVILMQGNTEI